MNKLISVVGANGAGKTALVCALAKSYHFATAFEQQDKKFALANQIDYFLLRAEQEKKPCA